MAKFPLTEMAVKMFCPDNVVQLDDAGLPSILVYIPAFKNSDVLIGGDDSIHPAFIVNGVQIAGFYYSKYQNVVYNGKAYSLPAEDPTVGSFNRAEQYSESKGYGWHLSTAAEWAAIALWCKKNGLNPYGNNNYGKDCHESNYKALPTYYNNDGNIGRVATGTGPLTWSHDGTKSGIWDMNGNIWEWQSGLRFVWGELQILANNDAADADNPKNTTSTCWKAINAADGSLVEPECSVSDSAAKSSGNTVKIDWVDSVWQYATGVSTENANAQCSFKNVICTTAIGDAAKSLLRALVLLPEEGASYSEGVDPAVWLKNTDEQFILRGGHWYNTTNAGLDSIMCQTRNATGEQFGFRSAYIPDIG